MSKKKAPALHERRGREDISTRPPRLAGSPIKLAGKTRLRRLSLAADSCVNRKYYGGDPGVGQRARGFAHKPCIRSGREGQGEFSAGESHALDEIAHQQNRHEAQDLRPQLFAAALKTCVPHQNGIAFQENGFSLRCHWIFLLC